MAGMLHVMQVVRVIHHALQVAFIIAHLVFVLIDVRFHALNSFLG